MILFSAEAILASSTSKSGIRIPLTDDEDLKSCIESTISTSLVQYIASVGNCEQVQVWGICRNEDPKSAVVVGLLHNSLKNLPH